MAIIYKEVLGGSVHHRVMLLIHLHILFVEGLYIFHGKYDIELRIGLYGIRAMDSLVSYLLL